MICDSWTGEIKKFRVQRYASESEFMYSPEEVIEAAEAKIKVDVSSNDLVEP